MPVGKPVIDLCNCGEILSDVAVEQPVFLTKNGHGRYAGLDMEEYREYERHKAKERQSAEPETGSPAEERDDWLPAEEIAAEPEIPTPKKHKKMNKKHK